MRVRVTSCSPSRRTADPWPLVPVPPSGAATDPHATRWTSLTTTVPVRTRAARRLARGGVAGPDARHETGVGVAHRRHRLLVVRHPGAATTTGRTSPPVAAPCAGRDVGQDGRLHEGGPEVGAGATTGQHPGTAVAGVLDVGQHPVQVLGRDQAAHVDRAVTGPAEPQPGQPRQELVGEPVCDSLVDVEPLAGGARLPGSPEAVPDGGSGRPRDVGVGGHVHARSCRRAPACTRSGSSPPAPPPAGPRPPSR